MAAAPDTAVGGKRKATADAGTGAGAVTASDPKRQQIDAAPAAAAAAGAGAGALDAGPFGADPTAADFDADQSRAVQVLTSLCTNGGAHSCFHVDDKGQAVDRAVQLRPGVACALVARAIAVDRFVTVQLRKRLQQQQHQQQQKADESGGPAVTATADASSIHQAMRHATRWVRVRASESDLTPVAVAASTSIRAMNGDEFHALLMAMLSAHKPSPSAHRSDHERDRLTLGVALFADYCNAYDGDEVDDVPMTAAAVADAPAAAADASSRSGTGNYAAGVVHWVVRALLCVRFVRAAEDGGGGGDAAPHSDESDNGDGDDVTSDSCELFDFACRLCPPAALALMALPDRRVAYGLDIDTAGPHDPDHRVPLHAALMMTAGARRSAAALCDRLMRESSAATRNAPVVDDQFDVRFVGDADADAERHSAVARNNRIRVPLLHWLIVRACDPIPNAEPVRGVYAAALALLCDRTISCDDGSGYPLCSVRYPYCGRPPVADRELDDAAAAYPPLLATDMVQAVVRGTRRYVRDDAKLIAPDVWPDIERYAHDGGDALCARVSQLVRSAVARIAAYPTNLPLELRAVLYNGVGACGGGDGSAAAKSSPFPLPLITLITGYVLHPHP